MSKKLKPVPTFKTEREEQEFWDTADTAEYFDFDKAESVLFPNLKPTTTTISIRLPDWMIARLKSLANARDIPYQSLLKLFVANQLKQELTRNTSEEK